jgi:hypothetical protein
MTDTANTSCIITTIYCHAPTRQIVEEREEMTWVVEVVWVLEERVLEERVLMKG